MLVSRLLFSLLGLLLLPIASFSQTSIQLENFSNGCTANCLANTYPGWSITSTGTNGAFANNWFISCAENGMPVGSCGAGCGANPSLHISNAPNSPGGLCPTGDCGAAYDASIASIITNQRVESPVINCTGHTGISMNYNFIAAGTPSVDFYEPMYSSNGGATWISLGPGPTSLCCCSFIDCFLSGCCAPTTTICGSLRQGQWTAANLALPASADNNPNVRVGFNWTNNGDNLGTDPSVAIDDLDIQGTLVLDQTLFTLNGQVLSPGNNLQWETPPLLNATEISLMKSTNGIDFRSIYSVFPQTKGNQQGEAFSFLDQNPAPNNNYYQLQIRKQNGEVYHGNVVELKGETGSKIQLDISPNPVSNHQNLKLDFYLPTSNRLNITFLDFRGKELSRQITVLEAGKHRLEIPVPELANGLYLLTIKGKDQYLQRKIFVQ